MSSEMIFKGSYRFDSKPALDEALAAVRELLAEDDPDFPDPFKSGALELKGLELRVDIDASCPSDWFFTYEAIVEILGRAASSGSVESTLEGSDGTETYPAGRDDDE